MAIFSKEKENDTNGAITKDDLEQLAEAIKYAVLADIDFASQKEKEEKDEKDEKDEKSADVTPSITREDIDALRKEINDTRAVLRDNLKNIPEGEREKDPDALLAEYFGYVE